MGDVSAAFSDVKSREVDVACGLETENWGARGFNLADPSGNCVEVELRKPRHATTSRAFSQPYARVPHRDHADHTSSGQVVVTRGPRMLQEMRSTAKAGTTKTSIQPPTRLMR